MQVSKPREVLEASFVHSQPLVVPRGLGPNILLQSDKIALSPVEERTYMRIFYSDFFNVMQATKRHETVWSFCLPMHVM